MRTISEFKKILGIDAEQSKGARFASFLYTTKGTGETALYTVLLGASYIEAYKRDLRTLESMECDGIEEQARQDLICSIRESLRKGLGNNSGYKQKSTWEHFHKGIRVNLTSGEFNILGFLISKKVIREGIEKSVKSSPLTIAKNKIEETLRRGKIRSFSLDNLGTVKLGGKEIVSKVIRKEVIQKKKVAKIPRIWFNREDMAERRREREREMMEGPEGWDGHKDSF